MTTLTTSIRLADLSRFRQLLWSLTWRDVRIRYKQSVLGIGWAILLPVSMMLVFTFVFTRALDAKSLLPTSMPYALYAYLGLVPWTFFSASLSGCVNSLVANRNLVTKIYFPREVFPLSSIGAAFVDFLIALGVLCALIAYFHLKGEWTFVAHSTLLFVPVIVLVQVMLSVGVGMMLAMANLFYRDVRQVYGVGIQLLMFISAVVVPVPSDGSLLARLISLNPLVPIISAYRDCVVLGQLPDGAAFVYSTLLAFVLMVGGWICFRKASYRFAECI